MNIGAVVIVTLLVLSFLGIPIYIALGIGTLSKRITRRNCISASSPSK